MPQSLPPIKFAAFDLAFFGRKTEKNINAKSRLHKRWLATLIATHFGFPGYVGIG